MPISWDAAMDRKLFFAILKVHKITVNANAVAELLSTEAQACTAIAVKRRLERINAMAKEGLADESASANDALKDSSKPRKRGATSTPTDTPAKKQKAAKAPTDKAACANVHGEPDGMAEEPSIKKEAEQSENDGP